MTNKLSNTQLNMFSECPTKYKFHYIERLRPLETGGALIFGTAIDKATEAMVLGQTDYMDVFLKTFQFQDVSGIPTDLSNTDMVMFSNSDFDPDLVYPEDKINVKQVWAIKFKKDEIGYAGLSQDEKLIFNRAAWTCLKNKGILMLEMCNKKILPNITKVLGTQVEINLTNDKGDSITGFADMVATWQDDPTPIIFDFKTSSKEYELDSVLTSQQLSLYKHSLSSQFENTNKAGYIVLLKNPEKNKTKICKKCGFDGSGARFETCNNEVDGTRCKGEWTETVKLKMNYQIIIDEIPEQTEAIVLENFDMINQSIKNGIFHRNFSSCKKQYGRTVIKCPYFDKCFFRSDKGLSKIEKPENK